MKEYRANNALALAIRAIFLGMPLAVCSMTTTSIYAATEHNISIAKKSLDQALIELAIQSGITISYDSATLSKLQSSGLNGHYSTEQAFALLLAPHHLEPVKIASGGYSIQAKVDTAPQDAQVVQLAPIHSQAAHLSNKNLVSSSKNELGVSQLPTISMVAASDKKLVNVGKSAQNLKEVPQSVTVISRERMDQQGLKTLDDVMLQTTGVTREQLWLNNNYSSRGLKIENIRYDGGGVSDIQDRNNSTDMAQYDAVELLRGADGLFGAGEAGGVINLSHKRPQVETAYQAALSAGSWNNYRAELDVTGALNSNQTIQGRAVAVLQDQDFFYKPTHNRREMLYGALNFDLTPQTRLFTGASYQKDKTDAFNASLPRWQDGADIGFSRSTTMGAPWSWMERENIAVFANLEHDLNDQWKTRLNLRYNMGDDGINGAEMEDAVNYQTLESTWWRYQDDTEFKEFTADANLQGSFDWLGQQHELIIGLDSKYNTKDYKQNWTSYGKGNPFNPAPPPEWDYPPNSWTTNSTNKSDTAAGYGSLKLKPTDKLAVILGGRYAFKDEIEIQNHNTGNKNIYKEDKKFTPYYGLTYDLLANTTIYGSFAEIYTPQGKYLETQTGPSLMPVEGSNLEFGIKTELTPKLLASLAYFKIKKDNEAVSLGWQSIANSNSWCCYVAAGSKRSEGFDVELNGLITDSWNISFGYTFNENEDRRENDAQFSTLTPKHLLKIWTDYKFSEFLEGLSIGGGVNAQSKSFQSGRVPTYDPVTNQYGNPMIDYQFAQEAYAVWSLRTAYEINPNLNISLNANNIFDKKYYSTIGTSGYGNFYGEPRSFLLTLKAKY